VTRTWDVMLDFDTKRYKSHVELTLQNRFAKERCQRAYIHMFNMQNRWANAPQPECIS
jgi:hypothetical protein